MASKKDVSGKGARRARHGGGDITTCALHWLPAAVLPCSVGAFQINAGLAGLPLVFVAAALGIVISAAVPQPRLACSVTIVVAFLLLGASYIQDLQAEQIRQIQEQDAINAKGGFMHRWPDFAAGHAAGSSGASQPALDHKAAAFTAAPAAFTAAPAAFAAVPATAPPRPALPASESVSLETFSVVLPCAFEGVYAERTVDAILAHTKISRLHEIIIVDDGSHPPLKETMPERLLTDSPGRPPIRILRHEVGVGLIGSKKAGGDAATGDVIAFLDCHINPRDGWEEAFLKQMKRRGDHRTVVVPTITALNPDTFQEIQGFPSSKACYLLWNADFTWLADPGRDVPLMSGGLLALSRRWWEETGGLDKRMIAWGGENIDQSLRAWLCGGRIEAAEGAYVAHMWRDPKNPKTQLKYKMPSEDVMRNKARAASAWLGEFKDKTFSFPEYEWFVSGQMSIGDMSNFDELRSRMQCKPFSHYIHRFSYVYIDSGLIPEKVFQLREEFTGRCLERRTRQNPPHYVVLAPCAGSDMPGGTSELQLWHPANRDRSRDKAPCCSGIANWNFLQCMDTPGRGAQITTMECAITGYSSGQSFRLQSGPEGSISLQWRSELEGGGCVGPMARKVADATRGQLGSCKARVQGVGSSSVAAGDGSGVPQNFRLVVAANPDKGIVEEACVTAGSNGENEGSFTLKFASCDKGNSEQTFHVKPLLQGVQVFVGDSGNMCLDAAGGGQMLVYSCYPAEVGNANQVWHIENGQLTWKGTGGNGYCVDIAEVVQQQDKTGQIVFASCAPKIGQRLKRDNIQNDGTFALKDLDTGKCLGTPSAQPGFERPLRMVECGPSQRWRSLEAREQVQHVETNFCLDAADEEKPIIYPCHEPKAMRKQKFKVVDKGSDTMVFQKSGWEDNGRKRYFDRCLDWKPEAPIEVTVQKCDQLKRRGIRWTKLNERTSPEFAMWERAEKPPPGAPPLGGDAMPP